ncbi:NgoMIV family type II restriction endonuclease [Kocuria sp. NPDC057446]|uniref:NgoMIV family type II restriction endonuclease n=1 Tax=Kocuria sp. NPDC057446 TaxID=3346137 RepID=UPI00369BD228
MPAPFAASLCGFRINNGQVTANPNTSDSNDSGSIELGRALFNELGVPTDRVVGKDPGARLEEAIQLHLQPLRPDLAILRSRSALEFEQYAHLRVFPAFVSNHKETAPTLEQLQKIAEQLPNSAATKRLKRRLAKATAEFGEQDRLSTRLKLYMPEESLLKLDLTCASVDEGRESFLHLGLSSKWSLRTDRAQDCVSQGSKLASQRRGPMPHYAVITMEPRPAMLKIIADQSGSVDYVYHLDLPALIRAMERVRSRKPAKWSPGVTFDRLLKQGRIRDYDDLVSAVQAIPARANSTIPQGAIEEAEEATGGGEER